MYLLSFIIAIVCSGQSTMHRPVPIQNAPIDLCFSLHTDSLWHIPVRGLATQVPLRVSIHNNSLNAVELKLMDALQISMLAQDATLHLMDGGRDGNLAHARATATLQPGDSITLHRDAKIQWMPAGTLKLQGADGYGGIWYVSNLQEGTYTLIIEFSGLPPALTNDAPGCRGHLMKKEITLTN